MSETPQKLGRYEILEEIGKGAMGVVYLARDPLIGRLVALKTFRIGFAARDDELTQFRSRFVREAQSAGILSHPNIVTIHDVVDEGLAGTCFIAMEYVKGTNLKQLLQRPDAFPLAFVVDILAQVAEALDYAHSRGVVHRDIKPANILITPDDRVKITDFGIARLDSSNLTMEGQLLGTPNYMAPEQIQGREVDHRADIFSLGVVFYEMLTRRKPFQGENLTAVTHKIVYDAFTPPQEIVRDVPSSFTDILGRCLEKDPNRRYPRASEVARELRAVLQSQQSLDDTVATQEVEPIVEAVDAPRAGPEKETPETASQAAPAPPKPDREDAAKPPPEGQEAEAQPKTAGQAAAVPPPDLSPTRRVERPQLPSPPAAPGDGAERVGDNAPTQLVARPAVPTEARARVVASPPRKAPPVPQPLAATVLSAVPRGGARALGEAPSTAAAPRPAPPPPAAAAEEAAFEPSSRRRLIVAVALAAVAAFALAAIAALWVRDRGDSVQLATDAAPAPTPGQQNRVTAAGAISEARSQLALGSLDAALQAVARAELAEPGNRETAALREEIEARKGELAEIEQQTRIDQGLQSARYALAERRFAEAAKAARAVLALAPENEEAKRIQLESDRALRRIREQAEAEAAAREAEAAKLAEVAAPVADVPVITVSAAKDGQIQVEFATDRSEGILTIYANERQILRQQFHFVRRKGIFSRERISGTIQASRKVAAGPLTLRVYVALEGSPTRSISIEGELEGGATRVLDIRVDADGNATAALR